MSSNNNNNNLKQIRSKKNDLVDNSDARLKKKHWYVELPKKNFVRSLGDILQNCHDACAVTVFRRIYHPKTTVVGRGESQNIDYGKNAKRKPPSLTLTNSLRRSRL